MFSYEWNIKDGYPAKGVKPNGLNVFGTFVCGGGSTMGYKLAGFNHLGGVEIDPKVAGVYKLNHNPQHLYVEDIRKFNQRGDLPKQLYDLDILDGSPPCSSFSIAGNREKDWSKKKVFSEGQAHQVLDDLVFEYINTILKLKPKVAILENVKGIIQGNAKSYTARIIDKLKKGGYKVQVFLLKAVDMGVPQTRERVFFVCLRDDLARPKLVLKFSHKKIKFGEIREEGATPIKPTTDIQLGLWNAKKPHHKTIADVRGRPSGFTDHIVKDSEVSPTIIAGGKYFCWSEPRWYSLKEFLKCGSYPQDYNFNGHNQQFLIGMSVPPVMIANISSEIARQWFNEVKCNDSR